MPAAFSGDRVIVATVYTASTSGGTSRTPSTPVAPATKIGPLLSVLMEQPV
jgi:hypothetical protein